MCDLLDGVHAGLWRGLDDLVLGVTGGVVPGAGLEKGVVQISDIFHNF